MGGANGQKLQLWSCEGSEEFKTWDGPVNRRLAAETPKEESEEPCLQVLCSAGSVLVGADSRGCGGRCEELPTHALAQEPQGLEFYWKHDSSYCMSVDDNSFRNGQKLQLWKCSGSKGQMFDYSQRLIKVAASPNYCVVIDGNNNYNGARIQLWECDANNLAQQWTVDGSSIGTPNSLTSASLSIRTRARM